MVLSGSESSGSDIQEKPDVCHRYRLNGSPHEVRLCSGLAVDTSDTSLLMGLRQTNFNFSISYLKQNMILMIKWFCLCSGIITLKKTLCQGVTAATPLGMARMLSQPVQIWTRLMEHIRSAPWSRDHMEEQTWRFLFFSRLLTCHVPSLCPHFYSSCSPNLFVCSMWMRHFKDRRWWLMHCVYVYADDLVQDVSWLWHDSSEWANMGPGATLSVEHFPIQRPAAHGSPWHLDI